MIKSIFKVVCLQDCNSMFGRFYKGRIYDCEVLDVDYKEKVRSGFRSRKNFIHYMIDDNGEIMTLDWYFDEFFMELSEYRKLKLERLGSLSSVGFGDKN